MSVSDQPAASVESTLCDLPPFRPIVARILAVSAAKNDDIRIDELAAVLQSDAAFGAEMLRVANSPLFGLRAKVSSVRHAVTIMGLERTKSLASKIALEGFLANSMETPVVRRCWLHSLACAEIAKHLAQLGGVVGEVAYTAGIMHDLGRLGLLRSSFANQYIQALKAQHGTLEDITAAELDVFGFDHCEAGGALCGIWGFPKELADIARLHHNPPPRDVNVLCVVAAACSLADAIGFDAVSYKERTSYEEIVSRLPGQLRGRFGLSAAQLEERIVHRILSFER